MPQRHHRHQEHVDDHGVDVTVDVDDERRPLTFVDASSGMLADDEREAIADAVGVDDDADLSPEEAAMHIERTDLDAFD
jgi:hypothetical protein